MNVESSLNSDSVADHVIHESDVEGAILTQGAGPVVQVQVPAGDNIVRIPVTAGETIQLPFPTDGLDARLGDENGNLAIKSGDVTVILQGYADANEAAPVEIVGSNGSPVDVAEVLASTDPNIDIQTAAGPAAGDAGTGPDNSGGIFAPFDPSDGIGGLDAVGGLEATSLNYTVIQRANSFYDPQDDDLTTLAVDEPTGIAPINYNDANSGDENGYRDTNVMIVLDVSGSMKEDADASVDGVQSRLEIAQAALSNLLHTYETLGDVRVTVVTFDKTASTAFSWGSVADAIAAIEAIILDPKAVTNYQAALATAETAWEAPGKLSGDVDNVVYFVSDGKPTWGGDKDNGNHLTAGQKAAWDAFLEDPSNGIDHVYAVGIGDDIGGSPAHPDRDLKDVADPDRDHVPAQDVLYVTDPLDLGSTLIGTIEGHSITGNVLDGSNTSQIGDNATPGQADSAGDGATHIYTLSYDSADDAYDVSFSWDGTSANVSQDAAGGINVVISGREVSFDTDSGRMTFHFDTGAYTFTPGGVSEDTNVVFHYGTKDADGDVDQADSGSGDNDQGGTSVPGGADLVITIHNTDTPDASLVASQHIDTYIAPTSLPGDHEAAALAAS
ncbi:VWA domain-containing protein [Dongia rigui]|uniref:VWA domain-containing protein n=1 Tax=Dongia rigui TaxID=940149 RepID=A0ABU5DZ22_9PROT|nr:VWA domain-containing protein [Dongia rigui]MDY0872558.1 VWA domain-containing protein [Dongia rigui]